MNFAKDILEKGGWAEGEGLGKDKKGIKKAVASSNKHDTKGLGIEVSEDFSFSWWDHIFNKTSASIKVDKDDESGEVEVVKQHHTAIQQTKSLLYGSFKKAGDGVSSSSKKEDFSIKISDSALFEACEGRTARKGARASQEGKLRRTALADSGILQKEIDFIHSDLSIVKHTKETDVLEELDEEAAPRKKRKSLKRERDPKTVESKKAKKKDSSSSPVTESNEAIMYDDKGNREKRSKKKRKEKKRLKERK